MRVETEIIVMPIIVAAIFFKFIVYDNNKTRTCVKVVAVGGCSKSGMCGMRLKDGRVGKMYYPTVGGEFCE